MKILDFNHCKSSSCSHFPNCGWNLQIGGTSEDELKMLRFFLIKSGWIESDLTDYAKKMNTENFTTSLPEKGVFGSG